MVRFIGAHGPGSLIPRDSCLISLHHEVALNDRGLLLWSEIKERLIWLNLIVIGKVATATTYTRSDLRSKRDTDVTGSSMLILPNVCQLMNESLGHILISDREIFRNAYRVSYRSIFQDSSRN